jgi:hypothetical protein
MIQKGLLLLWTVLVLIPFLHLPQRRDSWFRRLDLASNSFHILGHLAIYMVFVFLLAGVLEKLGVHRSAWGKRVFICVLTVGFLQELFQALAVGGFMGGDQFFDVAMDLLGGRVGLELYERRHPPRPNPSIAPKS